MSVIKAINDFFFKRHDSNSNTTALFALADITCSGCQDLLTALETPIFAQDLISAFEQRSRPNGPKVFLTGAAYEQFVKHLPPHWQQIEKKKPLSAIIAILGTIIHDLRDIQSHFREYFASESIEDKDIRMSNLIISGYVETAGKFYDWLRWMIVARNHFNTHGTKVNENDHNAPAKYVARSIEGVLPFVFQIEKEILYRRHGTTFLSILKAMREANKDVAVDNDGIGISTYAEDSSFSRVELEYAQVGLWNPFMIVSRQIEEIKRWRYDNARQLREWIQLRIAVLEQEQHGMDPESPEAKKIEDIMKKYLDQISDLDAKIKKYEIQS